MQSNSNLSSWKFRPPSVPVNQTTKPKELLNTSNYRYTPQIAGYYLIEGQIMEFDAGDNISVYSNLEKW